MAGLALPYLLPEVKNPDLQFKKYLNFLQALLSRKAGDIHVASKPIDISINPSTACQLHCPHCNTGNGTMDRPAVLMSPELHRHMTAGVMDELFVARYFGTGESLLNRSFAELLKQIEGKEIFTFITTNFSLKFTDQQLDELILSGLNLLGVSLDGAEQNTYGMYRVGGDHELVVTNMLRLIKRRNQLGLTCPLVQWRYLVFKHNEHEVSRVRELASSYEVDLLEFVPGCAPKNEKGKVQKVDKFNAQPAMSGPALQKAKKDKNTLLWRLLKQRKFEQRLPPDELKFKKCDWHYFGSYWYPEGGVGPCCHPAHVPEDFGTVTPENSFEDVWNGKRYTDARTLIRENKKIDNFCARCAGNAITDRKAIMDRFFITDMRGILLNAPAWALKILSSSPDLFFTPVDFYYLHAEIQTLVDNQREFGGSYDDIKARLRGLIAADNADDRRVKPLIELL